MNPCCFICHLKASSSIVLVATDCCKEQVCSGCAFSCDVGMCNHSALYCNRYNCWRGHLSRCSNEECAKLACSECKEVCSVCKRTECHECGSGEWKVCVNHHSKFCEKCESRGGSSRMGDEVIDMCKKCEP